MDGQNNTMGFQPSKFLNPRDVFDMFDYDGAYEQRPVKCLVCVCARLERCDCTRTWAWVCGKVFHQHCLRLTCTVNHSKHFTLAVSPPLTGNGTIDEAEFGLVMEYLGMDLSEQKLEDLFKRFDKDGSGEISYPYVMT